MKKKEKRSVEVQEPFVRYDEKGKWRHFVQGARKEIMTVQSWDTKEQAEAWVNWNNFGQGLYGEIRKINI